MIIPASQAVTVQVRMDWPGTGSVPAEPLIDPSAPGRYQETATTSLTAVADDVDGRVSTVSGKVQRLRRM